MPCGMFTPLNVTCPPCSAKLLHWGAIRLGQSLFHMGKTYSIRVKCLCSVELLHWGAAYFTGGISSDLRGLQKMAILPNEKKALNSLLPQVQRLLSEVLLRLKIQTSKIK